MKLLYICIAALLTSCNPNKLPSGEELINLMYNKNKDCWYNTLCFSQKVYNYKNDSLVSEDTWHEVYKTPGKLAIKFSNMDSGNGMLFSNDSMYIFDKGLITKKLERLHDLIVLGLDVNNQQPEITIEQAKRLGYNLNLVMEVEYEGKPAWVVGDTAKLCFWVNKNDLLFLKMKRVSEKGYREIEFSKYESIDGYPVATEIKFYNSPRSIEMIEQYYDIKVNCAVSDSAFNPNHFVSIKW